MNHGSQGSWAIWVRLNDLNVSSSASSFDTFKTTGRFGLLDVNERISERIGERLTELDNRTWDFVGDRGGRAESYGYSEVRFDVRVWIKRLR
jgi:hypothetical protein